MTLLELMFSIFVASILLTIAVPSFDWLMEKERLKGAAVRLAAETRQARAEAQSTGDSITVTVVAGEHWCIGLSDAGVCNCKTQGACRIHGAPREVAGTSFKGISVRSGDLAITFDPYHALKRPFLEEWPILLESDGGQRIGVHLTALGNAYLCAPEGADKSWGYSKCP